MAINKKYLYVSEDSMAAKKDRLREAIGSYWNVVSSKGTNTNRIRFGTKVAERLFRMEFGPVMVTEGAYAPYSAKHQIIKLTANAKKFGVYPECLECGWLDLTKSIVAPFQWAQGMSPQSALRLYTQRKKAYESALAMTSGATGTNSTTAIDYELIGDLVGDIIQSRFNTYKDCVFSIQAPLSKEEAAFAAIQNKYAYGNVDFEYDYYLEDYEKAIESLQLSELDLPNLYLLLGKEDENAFITRLRDNGQCRAKEYIALLGNAYNTLLIPNRVARTLPAVNAFKEFVPFQAEVEFTTDQITAAADSLRDSSTECSLMRRISEIPPETTRKFAVGREIYVSKNGKKYKNANISYPDVKSYDLFSWMEGMKNSAAPAAISTALPEGHVFLGPDNTSTMLALSGDADGLRKSMAFLILTGRIKDLLSGANRSMQEILIGAESHSETILYKIEKHNTLMYDLYEKALSDKGLEVEAVSADGSESTSSTAIDLSVISDALTEMVSESPPTPIQAIWVANSSDIDIFEYIDTQVKYDTDYTYVVKAYQLVVGSDYFYSTNKTGCEGWQIPLSLEASQLKIVNDIIEQSETMQTAYNNISAYLLSLGITSDNSGTLSRLPDYCGGDLMLSYNQQRMPILVCSCGDEGLTKRQKCIEELCNKFKKIRNTVTDEMLASRELEKQLASSVKTIGGRSPERIYKDLLSSGKSSQDGIRIMNEVLTNMLEYNLDYEFSGLSVESSDLNGSLIYSVKRDWQFSRQDDPSSRFTPTGLTPGATPVPRASSTHDGPSNNAARPDNTLEYDFDVNKHCPTSIDPCDFIFTATTIPSIMVYEVPYFIYGGTMVDTPPVSPGLEIVPYRNVNNKLLFNFNTGIGDYYDIPKIIQPSDVNRFKKVMRAQGVGSSTKVRFKTDDPAAAFQIFRSTEQPTRYTDFSDKLVKTVVTDVDPTTIQKADAAAHIENIEPNKKYYYTFRTIDIHGHFSNPTPIYEVELVDDDGAVYPVIRVVDISTYAPDDNVLSRKMKKLLHIIPTISQGSVNEERSNLENAQSALYSGKDIALGMQKQTVWGKKFKIRLVSRKTGKKIDFNLNFKTKHIENPDAPCNIETIEATTRAGETITSNQAIASAMTVTGGTIPNYVSSMFGEGSGEDGY